MHQPVGSFTRKKKYFTRSQDVLPVNHPAQEFTSLIEVKKQYQSMIKKELDALQELENQQTKQLDSWQQQIVKRQIHVKPFQVEQPRKKERIEKSSEEFRACFETLKLIHMQQLFGQLVRSLDFITKANTKNRASKYFRHNKLETKYFAVWKREVNEIKIKTGWDENKPKRIMLMRKRYGLLSVRRELSFLQLQQKIIKTVQNKRKYQFYEKLNILTTKHLFKLQVQGKIKAIERKRCGWIMKNLLEFSRTVGKCKQKMKLLSNIYCHRKINSYFELCKQFKLGKQKNQIAEQILNQIDLQDLSRQHQQNQYQEQLEDDDQPLFPNKQPNFVDKASKTEQHSPITNRKEKGFINSQLLSSLLEDSLQQYTQKYQKMLNDQQFTAFLIQLKRKCLIKKLNRKHKQQFYRQSQQKARFSNSKRQIGFFRKQSVFNIFERHPFVKKNSKMLVKQIKLNVIRFLKSQSQQIKRNHINKKRLCQHQAIPKKYLSTKFINRLKDHLIVNKKSKFNKQIADEWNKCYLLRKVICRWKQITSINSQQSQFSQQQYQQSSISQRKQNPSPSTGENKDVISKKQFYENGRQSQRIFQNGKQQQGRLSIATESNNAFKVNQKTSKLIASTSKQLNKEEKIQANLINSQDDSPTNIYQISSHQSGQLNQSQQQNILKQYLSKRRKGQFFNTFRTLCSLKPYSKQLIILRQSQCLQRVIYSSQLKSQKEFRATTNILNVETFLKINRSRSLFNTLGINHTQCQKITKCQISINKSKISKAIYSLKYNRQLNQTIRAKIQSFGLYIKKKYSFSFVKSLAAISHNNKQEKQLNQQRNISYQNKISSFLLLLKNNHIMHKKREEIEQLSVLRKKICFFEKLIIRQQANFDSQDGKINDQDIEHNKQIIHKNPLYVDLHLQQQYFDESVSGHSVVQSQNSELILVNYLQNKSNLVQEQSNLPSFKQIITDRQNLSMNTMQKNSENIYNVSHNDEESYQQNYQRFDKDDKSRTYKKQLQEESSQSQFDYSNISKRIFFKSFTKRLSKLVLLNTVQKIRKQRAVKQFIHLSLHKHSVKINKNKIIGNLFQQFTATLESIQRNRIHRQQNEELIRYFRQKYSKNLKKKTFMGLYLATELRYKENTKQKCFKGWQMFIQQKRLLKKYLKMQEQSKLKQPSYYPQSLSEKLKFEQLKR